jgi:hypothetical protein
MFSKCLFSFIADLYLVPKVLLVYAHTTPEFCNIANEFARFCRENLQIHILNDQIEYEMSFSNESETIQTNCSLWYREKISKSSAVIILWMSKQRDGHENSEFNTGVKLALSAKCKNDLKIICVYFDKTHKRFIPDVIQNEARLFHFPATLSKFCTYVLGHKLSRNITITKELSTLINNLSLNSRTTQPSIEDIIEHCNSTSDDEAKDENGTLHHAIRHEYAVFKAADSEDRPIMKHVDRQKNPKQINALMNLDEHLTSSSTEMTCNNQCFMSRGVHMDGSSDCPYSSDLSISRLGYKTIITIPRNDISSHSSESTGSLCESFTRIPSCSAPQGHPFHAVAVNSDSICDNYGIDEDSSQHINGDTATIPLRPDHRTFPYSDSYSVSSGSVRSSEDDLSEFIFDSN